MYPSGHVHSCEVNVYFCVLLTMCILAKYMYKLKKAVHCVRIYVCIYVCKKAVHYTKIHASR